MVKNILKSSVYFIIYFVLQMVSMVGMLVYEIASGASTFTMDDPELMAEELMDVLYKVSVPSLIISAILFFAIFILYKIIRKHPFDFKKIEVNKLLFFMCIGFLLNIVITLVVSGISLVLPKELVDALNASTDAALTGQSFALILLGTGILVPLLEELVFRYGICGTMARKNALAALIVSSLVFGIVHGNLIQGTYAAILGLIFGIVYLKTKNIWYPAIMHMAINSSTVVVSCFNLPWLYAVLAVVSIVGIVIFIKKYPELKNILKKDACLESHQDNQ